MADLAVELGARKQFLKATSASADANNSEVPPLLSVGVEAIAPGSGAASLGKAEDAVAGSGDVGVMALAVRANSPAATGANGDYVPLLTDTNGRLHVVEPIIATWDSSGACKSVAVQKSVVGTVSAANTIAAAGDYADDDIISQSASNGVGVPWKFTGLGRAASLGGTIVGASIKTSVTAFAATVRIHLFNAIPTASEFDDNEALSIHATDLSKYLGFVDIGASENMGGFSFAQVDTITKKFTADASADVYAIIQLTTAEAGESAGMSVYPTLHVIQD